MPDRNPTTQQYAYSRLGVHLMKTRSQIHTVTSFCNIQLRNYHISSCTCKIVLKNSPWCHYSLKRSAQLNRRDGIFLYRILKEHYLKRSINHFLFVKQKLLTFNIRALQQRRFADSVLFTWKYRVGRVLSFSPVVGIGTPPTPHPHASVPPPFSSGG